MNVATSSPVDDLLNPGESASRPVRILAAAGRMFIEHGYEGASMEEIAKAAAVTRQTLYNRFPEGKESLFVAVAERMWKAFPVMHVPTNDRALTDPRDGLMQIATEFACFWSGPTTADFLRMVDEVKHNSRQRLLESTLPCRCFNNRLSPSKTSVSWQMKSLVSAASTAACS